MISRRALLGGSMVAGIPTGIRGFRNQLLPFFEAGNRTVIDKNGIRQYAGKPAAGNLVWSEGQNGYKDKFGNQILAGTWQYNNDGTTWYAEGTSPGGSGAFQIVTATSEAGPYSQAVAITYLATQNVLQIEVIPAGSGIVLNAPAQIELFAPNVLIQDGKITGNNGTNTWVITTASDGHLVYSREMEFTNVASAPSAPATGVKPYALGGAWKVIGLDGVNYRTERLTLGGTALPQLVNSTGFNAITGLSVTLGAARYRIIGQVTLEGVAAAAGNPEFQFNGAATVSKMQINGLFHPNTGATIAINGANAQAFASTMIGQVLSITAQQVFDFSGEFTLSASGTFHLDAACSAAADTYNVVDAWFDIVPI